MRPSDVARALSLVVPVAGTPGATAAAACAAIVAGLAVGGNAATGFSVGVGGAIEVAVDVAVEVAVEVAVDATLVRTSESATERDRQPNNRSSVTTQAIRAKLFMYTMMAAIVIKRWAAPT